MIVQTVKIIKTKTADGSWEIKDASMMLGKETWVVPSRIVKKVVPPCMGAFVIAMAENISYYIPVEILEFTSEFSEYNAK